MIPAPVSAGEMSTPSSRRIIKALVTSTTNVVMFVSTLPSVCARFARSSASRPVPKLTSCSNRLTPTPTTRMVANATMITSRTLRPEWNAQALRVRSSSPVRGLSSTAWKAGKIRTKKTSANVPNPIRRSGARTIGLEVVMASRSRLRIAIVAACVPYAPPATPPPPSRAPPVRPAASRGDRETTAATFCNRA